MAWDLSPLRPWEYWQQDAQEWTEALAIRQAFDAGLAEYNDQKRSNEALAKADEKRVADMMKARS